MFDFLTTNPAIALLKKDHDTVKELFDKFKEAKGRAARKKIVRQAVTELSVHATIEEELFYPAVRSTVGKDKMNEADEEHHVAKLLVAELEEMDGLEDHYDAKFTVLAEDVRHHIREEEGEMFGKAKSAAIDFEQLAEKMAARKNALVNKGMPPTAEQTMVASSRGKGDSPALAAKKNKPQAAKGKAGKSGRRVTANAR